MYPSKGETYSKAPDTTSGVSMGPCLPCSQFCVLFRIITLSLFIIFTFLCGLLYFQIQQADGRSFGQFCGSSLPYDIVSTFSTMYFHFVTNTNIAFFGFSFTWEGMAVKFYRCLCKTNVISSRKVQQNPIILLNTL